MKKIIFICLSAVLLIVNVNAEEQDSQDSDSIGKITNINQKCVDGVIASKYNSVAVYGKSGIPFGPNAAYFDEILAEAIENCSQKEKYDSEEDNNSITETEDEDNATKCDIDNDCTSKCENNQNDPVNVIYDNDFFDPDWVISLASLLEMDRKDEANLLAVMITGIDEHEKAGMMYSSVLNYYNKEVPLGLNTRNTMLSAPVDATQDDPDLDESYEGMNRDITEFKSDNCLDTELCPATRGESVEVLCEVLQESDGNITYITGGQLYNLLDILKEEEYCDGKGLVSEKISQVIISTGWDEDSSDDYLDINLAEEGAEESEAPAASKYVFENMPSNVKIIVSSIADVNESRVGDEYKTMYTNSPMAFVYAVPSNGTWGDHGIGDSAAVLYGVRGDTSSDTKHVDVAETCFDISDEGTLSTSETCDNNHFLLRTNVSDYGDFIAEEVQKILF